MKSIVEFRYSLDFFGHVYFYSVYLSVLLQHILTSINGHTFRTEIASIPKEFALYLHIHNGFEDFIAHKITQNFKSSFCFFLLFFLSFPFVRVFFPLYTNFIAKLRQDKKRKKNVEKERERERMKNLECEPKLVHENSATVYINWVAKCLTFIRSLNETSLSSYQ